MAGFVSLNELSTGTDGFLYSLIARLGQDFGLITGSLAGVRLDPGLRTKAGEMLVPHKDHKVRFLCGLFWSRIGASEIPALGYLIRPSSIPKSICACHHAHSTKETINTPLRSTHPRQHVIIKVVSCCIVDCLASHVLAEI